MSDVVLLSFRESPPPRISLMGEIQERKSNQSPPLRIRLKADPRGGKSSRDRKRTGAFPRSSGDGLRDFDRTIRAYSEGIEIVRSIFRWNETSSRPKTTGRANLDWRPYRRLGRSRGARRKVERNESHLNVLLVVALPTPVYAFIQKLTGNYFINIIFIVFI
jgi:hypothetical protein